MIKKATSAALLFVALLIIGFLLAETADSESIKSRMNPEHIHEYQFNINHDK